MASKKKACGCSTIRCIEVAARKLGCTPGEFIRRAIRSAGGNDFNADTAAKKFSAFKEHGVANLHYEVPKSAIALAEKVLHRKRRGLRPRRINGDKSTRPSLSMNAR